jgi:Putative transposase
VGTAERPALAWRSASAAAAFKWSPIRARLQADGRVLIELKTAWRDGTSHLVFDPIEFLEKLAAITPRPAVNLVIYHGILAPRARWRSQVIRYGRPAPDATAPPADAGPAPAAPRGAWTWAALMHRVFALDVLACPRCGGRLRVIAIVQDPPSCGPSSPRVGARAPAAPGPAPAAIG